MPDVKVIQPTESLESALKRNELSVDPETVRVLGFPKFLFEFDIEIERKIIANRELSMSVTVDLLTGGCRKNDIYPEIQTRTLSATSLLSPQFGRSSAAETAHSFVRRQVNRGYKSFRAPTIQSIREDKVFKLFWIVPSSSPDTVHVIDTITNQLTAENIELDEFTQNSTTTTSE